MNEKRKRVIVDGIEFGSVVHFPRILTSALTALQPPRLIIALLMVTALITGGRLWDRLVPATIPPGGLDAAPWTDADRAEAQAVLRQALSAYAPLPEGQLDARDVAQQITSIYRGWLRDGTPAPSESVVLGALETINGVRPRGPFETAARAVADGFTRAIRGVLLLRPGDTIDAGLDLVVRLPVGLWRHEKVFTVVYGAFALLVLAVGGGALSRMAACQWSGGERLRLSEAWDFALANWWSLFAAPLLPALLVGICALLIAALGLLLRLPWLFQIVGALAYGVALVCGAMIAFLVLGYALGAPLLVPAVACERCDPAEAQQRAFAYVLNRPFHRLGYGITALIGLALGYLVVSFFAVVMLDGTATLFGSLAGDRPALAAIGRADLFSLMGDGVPPPIAGPDRWSAGIMTFFESIVRCLVAAYVVSYFFTAATLNYLLMRRTCDGQELQELWRPEPRVPGSAPGAAGDRAGAQ